MGVAGGRDAGTSGTGIMSMRLAADDRDSKKQQQTKDCSRSFGVFTGVKVATQPRPRQDQFCFVLASPS